MCCRPYWYNYVNDATTQDVPAELSNEMADELTYDAGSYYHNTVSKEASWQDPAESGWRAVQDPEGRTFWYHAKVRAALRRCCSSVSESMLLHLVLLYTPKYASHKFVNADWREYMGAAGATCLEAHPYRGWERLLPQRPYIRSAMGEASGAVMGESPVQPSCQHPVLVNYIIIIESHRWQPTV